MVPAGRRALATVGASPLAVPARLPLTSDDTRPMYLSVSSLALFWRWPERWRRRYLERQPEPQIGAMVVGKAVGATIAAYFAARMAGEVLSEMEADDLCLAEFDERAAQPLTDFGQEEPAELREQARGAARLPAGARPDRAPGLGRASVRAALRGRRVVDRRLLRRRGRLGGRDRRQGRSQARVGGAGRGRPAADHL